jgi:hypothetical protein
VEIHVCNTSAERGSNRAPSDKISKSGDGESSGDTVPYLITGSRVAPTKSISVEICVFLSRIVATN